MTVTTSTMRALRCPGCEAEYGIEPRWFGCEKCVDANGNAHWLEVAYDLDAVDVTRMSRFGRALDYAPLLPLRSPDLAPNLGAGGTPLLRIQSVNEALGLPNLWLKVEPVNPTASFKDRLHTVTVGVAREMGYTRAAIVTTGNSGVAAAAHAATAGLPLLVITDPGAPAEQLRLMRLYGAHITAPTSGGSVIVRARELMDSLVRDHGFYPCTVSGTYAGPGNPFGVEGYKTIAFEIAAQLGRAPDRMCVPTAGGDALFGPYKGFRELQQLGIIGSLPRMTACQASGANFIERSLAEGRNALLSVEPDTIALSIADPIGSTSILHAIRATDGDAWSAPDEDLLDIVKLLGRAGVAIEAASAAPVAALRRKVATGEIDPSETVVALLTGSGMKWPAQLDAAIGDHSPMLPDDLSSIIAAMGETR